MTEANMESLEESAIQILSDIKSALEGAGVTFWLDAGTLLKTVRDGSIIPSSDLDLALWQKDLDKLLVALRSLREKGYRVRTQGDLPFVEDTLKLYFPESMDAPFRHVDFYLYAPLGEEVVRRNPHKPYHRDRKSLWLYGLLTRIIAKDFDQGGFINVILRILPLGLRKWMARPVEWIYRYSATTFWFVLPRKNLERFDNIQLYGIEFCIPVDTPTYLEWRYGPHWDKPNPEWRVCDGKLIRIRKLRKGWKGDFARRSMSSDDFTVPKYKVKGIFDFSDEEISHIISLDSADNISSKGQ